MENRCQVCKFLSDPIKNLCNPADPNVCGPCKQLSEMDDKIKEVKLMLANLASERQQLKDQVNHHHDRLIHRLPPEIVADIFAFCIPDAMDVDLQDITSDSRHTICAPLIISSVCRYWRTIAHSAPQLWQTLFLCPLASSPRVFPQPWSIQKWIGRAGSLPLSISLYVSYERKYDGIAITSVLNRYADRWLHFKYIGHSELLESLAFDERDLPQLRTLQMKSMYRIHKKLITVRAKQLRSLSILGIPLDLINFNWEHLTHLEIGQTSLSECFDVLRRAPSLTHYTLRNSRSFGTGPEGGHRLLPQKPIVHSNVQYLEFAKIPLYKKVLEHVLLPSLTTLMFDFACEPCEMAKIIDFLKKSGCSLETLSLMYATLSMSDLVSLCQGIPTLQHLHIGFRSSSLVPSLFALLAKFSIVNGRKEPLYLPALRSFDLNTPMIRDASVTPVIHDWTMLPNIFGIPAPHSPEATECHRYALESVAISMRARIGSNPDGVVDAETLKRILWLREAGVKWKIEFKDLKLAGDLGGILSPWVAVEPM